MTSPHLQFSPAQCVLTNPNNFYKMYTECGNDFEIRCSELFKTSHMEVADITSTLRNVTQ